MANWTADKPAHVDTWYALYRLGQINEQGDKSGDIKMSEMTYFNPTVSTDSLKIEVTLIADTIDRLFTTFGAKLENNISRNKALVDMINILVDKDKTILDLAEKNDENYLFINERK